MVHDTISIRVGYNETDGQGRVHHAQYLNYFERGRVELMRSLGHSYREFEAGGLMLVVAEMNIKYQGAAAFDDLLCLKTTVVRSRGVRIEQREVRAVVVETPARPAVGDMAAVAPWPKPLAVAVIVPLTGVLVALAVALSGQSALTDQDIAHFIFTPIGFVAFLALVIVIMLGNHFDGDVDA